MDSPTYVPALKGLSESLLSSAAENLEAHLNLKSLDQTKEALVILVQAASIQPGLACLWKLMGEACTHLWQLPMELWAKGRQATLLHNLQRLLELITLCGA